MISQGLKVSGYVIEDELGRGGFGSVYLAIDEASGQQVAIKFLHPKSMRSETAQQTFIDEMINQARLSLNPNIVHIIRSIRYTEKQGQHLGMVMEYVDGEPLDMIIHRFSLLPASAAVPVFLQVLNGLSYAHDQNMLHRDLKPGNIMVGKDGLVKIMDFGLSKLVQGSTAASESARAASLNYVAPERLAKHHVDQRSDIYSLGATLYEALTGVPPYEIEPGNWQMASEKHNSGMFADIRKHYEYHPAELALLVKKSLDPDPAKRFATAREMLQALQQVPIESHKASTLPMELAAVTDTAGKLGLITKVIPDKPDAKPATIIDSQVDDAPAINVAPSTPAGTIANFEKTISPDVSQQKSSEQLVPDASQTGMKKNNRLLPVGAAVVLAIFVLVVVFAGQANKKEKEQLAAEQELRWRQEQVRAEEYAARERMKEVERQRQELAKREQVVREESLALNIWDHKRNDVVAEEIAKISTWGSRTTKWNIIEDVKNCINNCKKVVKSSELNEIEKYSEENVFTVPYVDTKRVQLVLIDKLNQLKISNTSTSTDTPVNQDKTLETEPSPPALGEPDKSLGEFQLPGRYPIASLCRLTYEDMKGMDKSELQIMRNEIFARHGYIFRINPKMVEYFNSQSWYTPRYQDVSNQLSEIEVYNVSFIKKHE